MDTTVMTKINIKNKHNNIENNNLSWSTKCFRHSLNCIPMVRDIHQGDARNLTQTRLQIFITSSNDITTILETWRKPR